MYRVYMYFPLSYFPTYWRLIILFLFLFLKDKPVCIMVYASVSEIIYSKQFPTIFYFKRILSSTALYSQDKTFPFVINDARLSTLEKGFLICRYLFCCRQLRNYKNGTHNAKFFIYSRCKNFQNLHDSL